MVAQFECDEAHGDELFLVQRLNTAAIIIDVRILGHFLHQFTTGNQVFVGQIEILGDVGFQRSNFSQRILRTFEPLTHTHAADEGSPPEC